MKFSILLPVKASLIAAVLLTTACSDAANNKATEQGEYISKPAAIELTVYKSRTCNCCQKWINHAEDHGFDVSARNITFMSDIKEDRGIASNYRSCHTAESSNGFVFEGHVPAKYIKQFLADVPKDSIGLSVPAMPIGTPGMEVDDRFMPYQILLLKEDGSSSVYAEIASYEEQF